MASPRTLIIPVPWTRRRETKPAWEDAPVREWRWCIYVRWCLLSLVCEIRSANIPAWRDTGWLYVALERPMQVEAIHIYYDGPNCVWCFGPLRIGRSGVNVGWCEKCDGES